MKKNIKKRYKSLNSIRSRQKQFPLDGETINWWYTRNEIAYFINVRLKVFRDAVKEGKNAGYPEIIKTDTNYSHIENFNERWCIILTDMLFVFEYYSDADKFNSMTLDEIDKKKSISLNLFAKYYENLWD
jgi:uncharacterized protein with gpF-like domain